MQRPPLLSVYSIPHNGSVHLAAALIRLVSSLKGMAVSNAHHMSNENTLPDKFPEAQVNVKTIVSASWK